MRWGVNVRMQSSNIVANIQLKEVNKILKKIKKCKFFEINCVTLKV